MQRIFMLIIMIWVLDAPAETAYIGFNWVDPIRERILADAMLIEENGIISYIGPAKPLGHSTHTVDLSGKYVISGFIDTHAHLGLGAVSLKETDGQYSLSANHSEEIARHNARMMLAYGITDIRDPGGETAFQVHYKSKLANGSWPGPEAFVAGHLLDASLFEGLSVAVKTPGDVDAEIKRQKDIGVDFIKLYTGLDEDLLGAGIRSAHRHGLKAVAHLDAVPWDRAVKLGLDGIVHMLPTSPELLDATSREAYLKSRRPGSFVFFEWYEAVDLGSSRIDQMISELVDRQTHLDLTLVPFRQAFWDDQPEVTASSDLQWVHPELLENWRTFFRFTVGWQAEDYARAKAVWPKVQQFTMMLYKAGVNMSVGTDMGNPWVIPGASYHQELKLLNEAGIPSYAVLKMATVSGAAAIGQQQHKGSLAAGKQADFVVLNSNPVENINNTRDIDAVVQSGRWFEHQQLLKKD